MPFFVRARMFYLTNCIMEREKLDLICEHLKSVVDLIDPRVSFQYANMLMNALGMLETFKNWRNSTMYEADNR